MLRFHHTCAWLAWTLRLLAWRTRPVPDIARLRSRRSRPRTPASSAALNRASMAAVAELAPRALRRAGRFTAASAGLAAGACLLAVGALAANARWQQGLYPAEFWQARLEERLRPLVVDRSSGAAGVLPNRPFREGQAGSTFVPRHCIDLVLAQEDRNHDKPWRHVMGVDVLALPVGLASGRGASTLPMQLARELAGWRRELSVVDRKLAELGAAHQLLELFGGDMQVLASVYLQVVPFAITNGGDVNGLAAFAGTVFGTDAAGLDAAQCAVAVASLPRPLRVGAGNADDARARFAHALRGARALLQRAGLATAKNVHRLTEVEAAGLPGSGATLDDATRANVVPILRWIERDQEARAW